MENSKTLYQHGTLALLVPGLLTGTITMGELLAHGNTGIGTGEGLDGELIILDGVAYQIDSKGNVNVLANDFIMPFANSHFANYQELTTISDATPAEFEKVSLDGKPNSNTFFSVLVKGTFSYMKTRAVAKSSRPFDTLAKTAEKQSIFEAKDVTGTLLSYYSPALFHGAAVAGFHNHFLADDHSIGGHVLDFKIKEGAVGIQVFDTLEQHLPITNTEFMEHDFSKDDVASAIAEAE
ncbi:acetolactate decarboxylase [Liquorilactobacillus cacaonum]|uniref:Alpha-acetolactate decarboxylase n=1 Tax=Liquorilactobacillus cacaonum DSM 21116 TaxID=1423729 RepID=A0A0R2CLM0_9LACO|nr:acetolactate decarboxylase [Liquorilactobacillus cacaonum]KRM92096.1 alpha-acetolactate decarboxylase [Liquorilactobacillus cacaonum DSM 21116]